MGNFNIENIHIGTSTDLSKMSIKNVSKNVMVKLLYISICICLCGVIVLSYG